MRSALLSHKARAAQRVDLIERMLRADCFAFFKVGIAFSVSTISKSGALI
jgi:hypothetical protein